MVVLDSNVYTAVDTLTNTEVAEHLRTLRTEHVQRLIRPLLQRLLLHPKNIGNLFNKPVDPVLLELPDYFIRIKKPMDLGTVKSRLQGGYYDSIDKATSDISLVFKNALIYNAPSHDIHLIAKMMKADFDADLLALKERRARETERKNTHRCDPCLGSSCPLCLEKCMKFDPPVLVCHGTCLQRVKKNSVYYVTVDGIMLWCQRCYTGLPSLILELTGRPPLLKKNLLKRRLDEEVAEPWVKCDKCDRPCHQICALYNNRISTTSSSNRADVDKDIAAPNGIGRIGEGVNGMSTPCTSSSSQDRYECPLCKQESLQQLDFKRTEASDVVRSQDSDIPSLPTTPAFTPLEKKKGVHYSEAVCELDETTSDSEMGECEGGLNAVKLQKQNNRLPTPVFVRAETRSRAGAAKVMSDTKVKSAMKAAQSPKQRLSRTSADAVPHAATAINTATSSQSVSTPIALSSTTPKKSDLIILAKGSALVEKEDIMDVTEDDNLVNDTPRLDPTTAPHPNGGEGSVMGKRNRGSDSDSAARVEPPAELPAHLIQWRASTLPRSRLGDFLEAMVAERLRSSGFEAAADTVTVRMTSNVEQYMELPLIITDNLRTSEGLCVPPYLGYRQKCILLFQRVDGVDICLFCLYVQEFGESCPEPNKSVVYIAYLDSVDFFRPMEARTLVYQEVMVGYFKWVQMRGFKQGHIWSCPPQRGDNFIFWCHPPHQRTPSRDRLNAWYNSILLRSSKLGVLEEVGTLWSACFSGYGRRELSGRKDKVGEEQKSSEVAVSNETPSAEEVFSVNLSPAVSTSAAPSSSCGRQRKSDSTTAAGGEPEDAPVCPPVFEGDFWVTECLRVHRLMMARSKGCDGQDRGVNQRKCRDLLKDLMSKPLSLPFCRPVDTVKLGIPDYLIVVTQPMDLGTIRDLLRTRYYKSILHFAENVRLTFCNALKYNPIGHPINESARLLSVEFESCLVELLSEYIGAVPKAENVDKYLDTYPIADIATPVPQPSSDLVDRFESKSGSASRVPPLKLPLGDGSAAKGWSMQSPNGMLESVLEEGEGDSIIGDQTPCNRTLWDVSGTPRLRRADSMDSIQSYGSAANENSNMGEDWTPRVLFTSAAVSGPLPQSPMEGPDSERKPFEKPALGFKGAMALMSEIAKSVFRLKDDLFVIKFSTIMTRPDKAMKKRPTVGHSSNRTFGEGLSNPDCEEDKADSEDEAYPSPIPPICRSSDMTSLKDTPNVGQPGQCDVADDSNPSLGIIAMEDIKDNHVDGLTNGHSIDGEKIVADSSAQSVTEAMPNHFGVLPSLPSGSIDSITASSSSNSVAVEQADLVAIVPVTVRVAPPSAAGRRGRDANRNRKTHQKKGKTPRGKSRGKAKSSSESVSSTGAITAATMANRAKGGKAGAYLRRLDQSDRGEGDFEEELSDRCLDLLTNLVPDTSDPDPLVKCAFVDSRHTFLEMCQFRHYQFDSLRRAKHSSLMLLYHLHFPDNTNARPTCACCNGPIRDVRWHCDQCTDFDMCDACYYAGEAEVQVVISTPNLSTAKKCKYQASESDLGPTSATPSISHSHSTGKKGKEDFVKKEEHTPPPPQPLPLPVKSKKHLHTLTPFRITYI